MRKVRFFMVLCVAVLCVAVCFPALAEEAELTAAGVDRSLYPWGEYLTDTDVVSEALGKDVYIQYTDLFSEEVYENSVGDIGDITYYLYDPIAHGADPEKDYPVALWLHGAGNSTQGKTAVMLCGAAAFATEEFQNDFGGMYIVFPMANPEIGWSDDFENYSTILKGLLDQVIADHSIKGEVVLAGQSMGGFMVNALLEHYAEDVDIVMWINTTLPSVEQVRQYSENGMIMWAENGIHDESISFDTVYPDGPEAYAGIENFHQTILEWIRNGDKSIVTINYGEDASSEMGQHCSCLQYNRNLIFDDGTPDDPELPEGATGWLRDALALKRG